MIQHDAIIEAVQGALGGGVGWWLFSSWVGTMPPPKESERWYGWFYRFVQLLAANHQLRNAAIEKPDSPIIKP